VTTQLQKEINQGHGKDLFPIPNPLTKKYKFIKTLGKGSFGVVFLVNNIQNKRDLAMKIMQIKEDLEANISVLEMMEYTKKKNDITASLKNESIISFYETIVLPEYTMIAVVMEYAEKCLSDVLKNKISEKEAQNYILQLCEGVRYLHEELFVIHRDLKPENILIKGDHVKICDFDTAKQKTGKGKNTEVTFIVGTKRYAAPEVLNGSAQISEKVDIWSLGIIIHQILTGNVHPFDSDQTKNSMGNFNLHESIKDKNMIKILTGCFKIKPEERISIEEINTLLGNKKQSNEESDEEVLFQKSVINQKLKINKSKEEIEEKKEVEQLADFSKFRKIDYTEYEIGQEIQLGYLKFCRVFDKVKQRHYSMKILDREQINNDSSYAKSINMYYRMSLAFNTFKYSLKHKNILQLEEICRDDKQNLVLFLEDYFNISLVDVLELKRLKKAEIYTEKQIIYVFSGIFEFFLKAKEQGIFHGMITSNHFALVQDVKSKEFMFKISGFELSLDLWIISKLQDDEMISTDNIDFELLTKKYSAPELYKLVNSAIKAKYNPFQADVFSLGIVLLEMMGLTNENLRLMRRQKFKNFNPYLALDYPHLLPIVKKMLKADPNQRITYQEIYNQMVTLDKSPINESEIVEEIQILFAVKDFQEEIKARKINDLFDQIGDQKKGTIEKCGNDHELFWSKAKGTYEEENARCEKCQRKIEVKNGRWNCEECDYNICPKCRRVPHGETKTCNEKHPLLWNSTQGKYPIPSYLCDLCKSTGDILKGRWHCEICQYDLCHECRGSGT